MSQPLAEQSRRDREGRTRRGFRLAMRIAVCLLVATVSGVMAGMYFGTEHLADNVRRYPGVFAGVPEQARPPDTKAETEALSILLVGSDTRADAPTTGTGAGSTGDTLGRGRSDVVMLVRIDKEFTHATVVSFPRDSWVAVPGHGRAKVNASFALGGPSLLVRTIEGVTGTRIDHFMVIDFAGFRSLTDAVGGIDVHVTTRTTFGSLVFQPGTNHLNGEQALAYVRQRKGLPGGDLDRVRRHQSAIRALVTKVASDGEFDSTRAYGFAVELSRWITVDETLTNDRLRTIAMQLPGLGAGDITFLTAPVAGLGREGDQSVVYLDAVRCARLWLALAGSDMRNDIEIYVRSDPGSVLGHTTP